MKHFFDPESDWHPFRWFIAIAAALTIGMSYADYTGWRLMSFTGSQQRGYTYNGGISGHK